MTSYHSDSSHRRDDSQRSNSRLDKSNYANLEVASFENPELLEALGNFVRSAVDYVAQDPGLFGRGRGWTYSSDLELGEAGKLKVGGTYEMAVGDEFAEMRILRRVV